MQKGREGEFQKQEFELKIDNYLNVGDHSIQEQSSRREYQSFLDQQEEFNNEDNKNDGQSQFRQSSNKEIKNQYTGNDKNSVLNNQHQLSDEHLSKENEQQVTSSKNNNVPPLTFNFLHHNNSLQTDSARGTNRNQLGSSHGEETGVFGAKSSLQNTVLSSQRIPNKDNMMKNVDQNEKQSRDSIFHEDILEKNQNSFRQQLSQPNSSKVILSGSLKNIQENNNHNHSYINSNNNSKNNQDDQHYFASAIYQKGGQNAAGSFHNNNSSVNDLSQISQKGSTKQFNTFAPDNQAAGKQGNTKNLLEEVFKEDNIIHINLETKKEINNNNNNTNNKKDASHNGTMNNSFKHSRIDEKEIESQKQQQSNLHNSSFDYQSINNTQKDHFDTSIIHNLNNNNTNASQNINDNTHNNQINKQQQQLDSELMPTRDVHSYNVDQINEEPNNEKESQSSQKHKLYISEIIQADKGKSNNVNNSIDKILQESPVLSRLMQDQDPHFENSSPQQRFTLGQIPAQTKQNSPTRNSQFFSAIKEGQLFHSQDTPFLYQSHQTDIHRRQTSEVSDIFETESTKHGYWKEKYEIVANKEKQYRKSIEDQRSALQVLKSDINKMEFLHRMEKFPMMRSQTGSETNEESKIQTWHVVIFGMISYALGFILKKITL